MQMNNLIEILLVEDNPDDVELTLRALKKCNVANSIQVARDGEEALEIIQCKGKYALRNTDNRPRVVLLDLKLPKVDGLEVLHTIKSDEKTKTIPVVILTASKEEQDIVKSYQLGANSYIIKPVDFNKFVQTITELGLYWLIINKQPGY